MNPGYEDVLYNSSSSDESSQSYGEDTDGEEEDGYFTEDIYQYDRSHHEQDEPENGKYFIGSHHNLLLDYYVSPRVFYLFPYRNIVKYIGDYSIYSRYSQENKPPIHIMKLELIDEMYTVILQTHWIKLVQRKWRNVIAERNKIFAFRKSIACHQYFQIYGKYPFGFNSIPSIRGMLHGI